MTSSTWASLYSGLWERAVKARGQVRSIGGWKGKPSEAPPGALVSGTIAPGLTNAEAVSLIRGFRLAAATRFALWYAYAAVAYGWDPPDNDALDASVARAGLPYSNDICVALWMELYRVAKVLDHDGVAARLDLDIADFSEVGWISLVRQQLQAEGADALFKIPTGTCTDKKTKRRRFPRFPCDKDGKLLNPITGKRDLPCDSPGDCPPDMVDDPLTALGKKLLPLAAVLVALWLLTRDTKPRRRRRSES